MKNSEELELQYETVHELVAELTTLAAEEDDPERKLDAILVGITTSTPP